MKLLLADNDRNICKTLKKALEKNNYTVDTASDKEEILTMLSHVPYDAVVIDDTMPENDVADVISDMREREIKIPVIAISDKTDPEDIVRILDSGADDCLSKPFTVSELMARIRAVLRRGASYTRNEVSFGNLKLDCSGNVLYTKDGSFNMNNKEFQMIEYFMRNPGKTFSTEDLMSRFWGWESDSAINVVWTNIANLRRKLKTLKADSKLTSIRGVGYKLERI